MQSLNCRAVACLASVFPGGHVALSLPQAKCPNPHKHLVLPSFSFLNCGHLDGYVVKFHCFNLHFPDGYQCLSLGVLICIHSPSLVKCLFISFALIPIGSFQCPLLRGLYVLQIQILCQICDLKMSSPTVQFLFLSFKQDPLQKTLKTFLMKFILSGVHFLDHAVPFHCHVLELFAQCISALWLNVDIHGKMAQSRPMTSLLDSAMV